MEARSLSSSSGSRLAFGLALIPFLYSIGVGFTEHRPAEITSPLNRPALAFDEYVYDLGPYPIQPRPVVFAHFKFKNRGEQRVHITELKPSCGCLNPEIEKREFDPGESGDLFLAVRTASQEPGPQEYTLKVHYSDPEPREVDLGFTLVLPEERVVIRPRSLLFYQYGTDPTRHEVVVTDYRCVKLNVTDVEAKSELVTAELTGVRNTPEGTRQFRVAVEAAGKVPAGRHRAVVNIHTDDPEHPLVQLPLIIEGPPAEPETRSTSKVIVEPERLILSAQHDNRPVEARIQIDGDNAPEVIRVNSDLPCLSADATLETSSDKGQRSIRLKVRLTDEAPSAPLRGVITIHTVSEDYPRIQVPITISK